jgi:ABC-type glycerol-3-phosphate transport system substrate-binding protein
MSEGNSSDDRRRSSVSRRRFVTAAGAAGVVAGLAGCANFVGGDSGNGADGTQTGSSGQDSTTVQWAFDPTAVQENGEDIRRALHELGGLSDDITVDLIQPAEETQARQENITRLLRAGENSPDMFLMDNGWTNTFIQAGLIENLNEMVDDEILSTVDEEFFDGFTSTARNPGSGDLYGIPMFASFPAMLYRKDLVEKAGYSPEENNWATEPMTWEKWSHITADTLDNTDVDHGWTTQWDVYEGTACCTFNEVLSSWGGAYFGGRENLFGPVGDRPVTVDSEPVIQSLNMMHRFVHGEEVGTEYNGIKINEMAGDIASTDILGWNENPSFAPFREGNAVMHRNWPYAIALSGRDPEEAAEPALGENLGTMPIPYAVSEEDAEFQGTGGTTSALGGWHATVNPNSDKQDATVEVIRAMLDPEFQLELLSLQGWLPPRSELFGSDEAQNVPVMGQFMDTLQVIGENVMPRPVTAVWPDQSSAIAEQANSAVAGDMSSTNAMASLQTTLEKIEQS